MTDYTFDDNIISDLHKDARGFRPNEYFWEEWTQSPDDAKQQIWDSLCIEMEQSMAEQKAAEAAAVTTAGAVFAWLAEIRSLILVSGISVPALVAALAAA